MTQTEKIIIADDDPLFRQALLGTLKVKFKEYKFVKHFHLSKRYLYRLILAALRNYHKEISPKAELNEILKEATSLNQPTMVDIICQPLQDAKAPVSEWVA